MTLRLIRRLTLIAVFAVLAMWSCRLALAQPTQPATTPPTQPLSIARQGYFFVGGHLFPFNGDQAMAGQMFVQYQVPAGTAKPYPVVMVHGGGQTGTNFLGTPDGRPGWNEWFLRQGYAVYIVDQPARGRSAYYPAVQGSTAPSLAHGTEQRFTAPEKYNLWPQAKLHTQWPGSGNQGDPIFDQFFASQETSITDNILMDESNRDDLVALLERIGPAIMLTHSRSGPFGWLVADARPDLVRAILAIEPNGPPFFDVVPSAATPTFVRAWGIAYAKLHFDPPVEQPASLAPGLDTADDGPDMERCWLPTGAKRTLPGLQRMPILILSSEASYHAQYDQCTVRFLMRNGVQPDFVRLSDIGIHGNGHMMMIEKNNEQVAKVLTDWLDQRVR